MTWPVDAVRIISVRCKRRQVVDALDRIAKIPHPEVMPALGSEKIWDYRNKMEYTFSAKSWITGSSFFRFAIQISFSGCKIKQKILRAQLFCRGVDGSAGQMSYE